MTNNFSGVVQQFLTALRLLDNHFHAEISPRIGNLKHRSFLSLVRNSFTNITKTLHALKSCRNISTLLIGRNFMNEAMPQDETIDGFQNLQHLAMHHCSLTGRIPIWLSKLTNLKILVLLNNQLTGPMPSWINSLNHLFLLSVSNNSLTGEIPINLMQMPMLKSDTPGTFSDRSLLDIALLMYGAAPSLQYRIGSAWPKSWCE